MADENYDKMSDEDFEDLLDNIDDIEDPIEDTDQIDEESESEEEEAETNEEDDDFLDDTEEDSEDEEDDLDEENSHEIEDDDEDDTEESTEDDAKDTEDDESEDQVAPEDMTTQDKIDYQKAYEEALAEKEQYQAFYNQVTSEFVANGKTMRGFSDPKKIIQAQQMAAGFGEKMKAFKKYRPFTTTLEEKGLLDNPEKFNLMINAMDGNQEAIKKLIKNAEIDPVELDMDNIDYTPTNSLASSMEMAYEDVLDSASQNGVKEQVEKVISGEWDDQSIIELLDDPENSSDLVNHLSTGVYDMVQERIAEKKMTDVNGVYSNKKSIEQYREAAQELDEEYRQFVANKQQQELNDNTGSSEVEDNGFGNQESQFSEEEIQKEIDRIKEERIYAAKVEKKNAQAASGRKKAASVSKKKPRTKKSDNSFDPGKLSDDEFSAYLDSMIY